MNDIYSVVLKRTVNQLIDYGWDRDEAIEVVEELFTYRDVMQYLDLNNVDATVQELARIVAEEKEKIENQARQV